MAGNTATRIITKAVASGDRGADSIVCNDGGMKCYQVGTVRCRALAQIHALIYVKSQLLDGAARGNGTRVLEHGWAGPGTRLHASSHHHKAAKQRKFMWHI
jgi:hypothetical protein